MGFLPGAVLIIAMWALFATTLNVSMAGCAAGLCWPLMEPSASRCLTSAAKAGRHRTDRAGRSLVGCCWAAAMPLLMLAAERLTACEQALPEPCGAIGVESCLRPCSIPAPG
jgi:hypothetical protein